MICSRAGLGAFRAGSAPNDLRAADHEITAVPPLTDDMVFHATDHSETSQILGDLAFHLAGTGFDVQVLTSRQIYDDPARVLAAREGRLLHAARSRPSLAISI